MPTRKSSAKSSKLSKRKSDERTKLGRQIALSLRNVLGHMEGTRELETKVLLPPVDVRAIRKSQGLTRGEFALRYGLQPRTIQEWEQGRRTPESAAHAYLLVIQNEPAAVQRALGDHR
jgi:putative transcriptional regulator